MDSFWISWIPIFILLFIIIPQQNAAKARMLRIKRKRGIAMTNEIIQKYIGKACIISNGSLGESITGRITEVNENWIEVETKKGNAVLNLDYIQNIREKN